MKATIEKTGIRAVMLLVSLIVFIPGVMAQRGMGREKAKDKILAQQAAFITKELDLSPKEAQEFWPVFNEYQAKKSAMRKEYMDKYGKMKMDIDKLTEDQLKDLADGQILQEQRILDLNKEYHAKFKTVLPMKKVVMLYQAEHQFRKMLLKKVQEGPRGRGNQRGFRDN